MYATWNLNWLNGIYASGNHFQLNPIQSTNEIFIWNSARHICNVLMLIAHCSLPNDHYKHSHWLFYLNYLMQTHLIELFIGRCAATHRKILKLWIMSQAFAFNQLWMVDEKLIFCVCATKITTFQRKRIRSWLTTSREFDWTSHEIMIFLKNQKMNPSKLVGISNGTKNIFDFHDILN